MPGAGLSRCIDSAWAAIGLGLPLREEKLLMRATCTIMACCHRETPLGAVAISKSRRRDCSAALAMTIAVSSSTVQRD